MILGIEAALIALIYLLVLGLALETAPVCDCGREDCGGGCNLKRRDRRR